jgi:ABC-type transport system substrate-binding protein
VQPSFSPCSVVQGDWEELGQQIVSETDTEARLALWEEWWDYYVDEAAEITLYHIDLTMAINSEFEWTPRADGWMTFRDLRLRR